MENKVNFNKKLQSKFGFPVTIFNYAYQRCPDIKFLVHCLGCGSAQLRSLKKQITKAKKNFSMHQLASFVLEFNAAHGLVDLTADNEFSQLFPHLGRIVGVQLKTMEKEARKEARKKADESYKNLKELTDSYKKAQAIHTNNWLALKKKIEGYVKVIKMKQKDLADVGDLKGLPEMPKAPAPEAPKPETPTPATEPAPLTPKKEGKLIKYKLNRMDASKIVKKLAEGIKGDPNKNEFFITFIQETK